MSNREERNQKIKDWLSKEENKNIDATILPEKGRKKEGFMIYLDTLNKQQLNELNDLTQPENE